MESGYTMIISYVQLEAKTFYVYQMLYVQSLGNDGIFLNVFLHFPNILKNKH